MEQLEQEEAAAGSIIAVKKKKGKGKSTGRQTKLTSVAGVSTNSFKVTQPSPFAEAIDPVIPEFNAQPKKASGGRGRGKAAIKMEDSKEGIKSPEKTAAAKAVRDAFDLSDDETPPPSLFERLKGKGKKQSQLKFQKKPESSDDDDDDETPPRKTAKRQKSGTDSEEEFGIPVPKKAAVKKSVSKKATTTTKPAPKRVLKSSKPTSKVCYKKILFTIITLP